MKTLRITLLTITLLTITFLSTRGCYSHLFGLLSDKGTVRNMSVAEIKAIVLLMQRSSTEEHNKTQDTDVKDPSANQSPHQNSTDRSQ